MKYRFLAVALTLLFAACANNDVVLKKQMETDTRLEQLVQGTSATNTRLAEITRELVDLREQVRGNAADLAELKPEVGRLRAALEAGNVQKEPETVAAKEVPRIEVVNRDPSPGGRESAAQNAYMKAFGLYSANNYSVAIEAFDSFITTYPDSEYAGNAAYWIGECYYTRQDYDQAVTAFNRVLTNYPNGKKVPDAMLKIGFSYIGLSDRPRAREALQALVDKYPSSPAAIKARERLSRF